MNVRNVVKVMNFHALLRVDKARRTAEKYRYMDEQLLSMIDSIMNNRNFILDKKAWKINPAMPELNIYMGSDYGFCSNFNSQLSDVLGKDQTGDKIIIGKKLFRTMERILLKINEDDFTNEVGAVQQIMCDGVLNQSYSAIYIVYNHYIDTTHTELRKKQVYPIVLDQSVRHTEDFVVEGDLNLLLQDLILTYVKYQLLLAQVSSAAAENLMRQNATTESLKRIDEIEEENHREMLRSKRAKEFEKVIEGFIRMKGSPKMTEEKR